MTSNRVIHWLQMCRVQTAPATIIIVVASYLVGGGRLFALNGLLVGAFALAAHWLTFGHNSLMDTQGGWDTKDQHKQHHPLVVGTISLGSAHNAIHTGLFFLTPFAVGLVLLGGGNPFLAMVSFSIFLTAGHCYNDGLSKTTIWSFAPITVCFTSLALFSYYVVAKETTPLMLCLALYIALTMLFEISWEGECKEITADEANLLRSMGVECDGERFKAGPAKVYGWGVKSLNLAVGGYILCRYVLTPLTAVLFLVLAGLAVYFCHELTKDRVWDRHRTVVYCASEEIVSIYIMPAILIPVIGLAESLSLMAFGILYFTFFNRVLWGTTIGPRV